MMSYMFWQKKLCTWNPNFQQQQKLLSYSPHFGLTVSVWAHTKCWLAGIAIKADVINPVIHRNTFI
jgi:hypothetical protein